MALFTSVKLEVSGGRTIEYIEHCHRNLLMYKLLTSTDFEYESGFVRNHASVKRGHTYMMAKMCDRFGFVNDLEKIIYGLELKIILKRNKNDRALSRINTDADAAVNDEKIKIRDISWRVPSIDFSNDKGIIVQKRLNKKNNIDFSYYERKTFFKKVPNATNFLFDLEMESGMERQQYIIIGLENKNVNERTHDASTFDIMSVTECYRKIGSEFYPGWVLSFGLGLVLAIDFTTKGLYFLTSIILYIEI